jgi:hypothetical protein
MAKRIWESKAISIIVLPSGDQGLKILDLAQEWTRSWLLSPALWMLADEIPDSPELRGVELQTPPKLEAYLLGRDEEQNAVREKVDVFWTLGSQAFDKIRFIAVRTEQNDELMERTSARAKNAAVFIQRAVPDFVTKVTDELLSAPFMKYNLVIAPTNDRKFREKIIDGFWSANLIAAAEDRSTPRSTDSFVKVEERFVGFALAHIATTAGLWAGLPISSAEIKSERTQQRQARLQRVFVRGVTSDALSADIAHWAIQKLNFSDTSSEVSLTEGHGVVTIAAERQEYFMNELVEFIMKGPSGEGQKDSFLYSPFQSSAFTPPQISVFKKLLLRIQDMGEGLAALPRWFGAAASYRLNYAIDDEYDDEILYKAVPERLAPRVKLPPVDLIIASVKPKLPMPTPELWRHMRTSISAAIDAPTDRHPEVLRDEKDDKFLVFSAVDQVLPDPESSWSGEKYSSGTTVPFETIGWLDAATMHATVTGLQARVDELEPGIIDARAQLSETQKLVNEAKVDLGIVVDDLNLIETELDSDVRNSSKVKDNHTHKLPRAVTEKAKRVSQGGKTSKSLESKNKAKARSLQSLEDDIEEQQPKKSFWRRVFRRKSRGNS